MPRKAARSARRTPAPRKTKRDDTRSEPAPGVPRPNLGERVREIRLVKRISLSDAAKRTGIARSTLYKVENSGMSLTYDKLLSLAEGLQIDIADLFSSHPGVTAASGMLTRRQQGRLGDGFMVRTKVYDYEYVCNELARKRMVPMIGRIKARSLAEFGQLVAHPGEEFTYVLEGTIEIHTSFYQPMHLETGEYVYMDSTMPHAYLSVGKGDALTLTVCSAPTSDLPATLMTLLPESKPQDRSRERAASRG